MLVPARITQYIKQCQMLTARLNNALINECHCTKSIDSDYVCESCSTLLSMTLAFSVPAIATNSS